MDRAGSQPSAHHWNPASEPQTSSYASKFLVNEGRDLRHLLRKRFAAGLGRDKTEQYAQYVDQGNDRPHLGVASKVGDELAARQGSKRRNHSSCVVTDALTGRAHARGEELGEIQGEKSVKRRRGKGNTADFQ